VIAIAISEKLMHHTPYLRTGKEVEKNESETVQLLPETSSEIEVLEIDYNEWLRWSIVLLRSWHCIFLREKEQTKII
jgi:hypothetical protein